MIEKLLDTVVFLILFVMAIAGVILIGKFLLLFIKFIILL